MHHTQTSQILLGVAFALAAGCIDDRTVDVNTAPVAKAGRDQQLDFSGEPVRVRLDGRASSDGDGEVVAYLWRSADAPDAGAPAADLNPEDVARPELELGQGSYSFTLWVRDDDDATSLPDSVSVRIGTDPVAECEGGLPEQFQNDCGSCVCAASAECRDAARACDDACWGLIGCIASHCSDAADVSCITSMCAAFLGGATSAMTFAGAGCLEPCVDVCTASVGADAG